MEGKKYRQVIYSFILQFIPKEDAVLYKEFFFSFYTFNGSST